MKNKILLFIPLFCLCYEAHTQIEQNDHFASLRFAYSSYKSDQSGGPDEQKGLLLYATYNYFPLKYLYVSGLVGFRPFIEPHFPYTMQNFKGKSSVPMAFGIGYNYNINPELALQAELQYFYEKQIRSIENTDGNGDIYATTDIVNKVYGPSLNTALSYRLNQRFRIFCSVNLFYISTVVSNQVYSDNTGTFEYSLTSKEVGIDIISRSPSLGLIIKLNK